LEPFNIELLFLNNNNIKQLKPVTSMNIFEPNTKIFAVDGLFSQEIFGAVGSPIRNEKFGYINISLPILHPLVYRSLIKLKAFYKDILSGKKYAIFDTDINDFTLAPEEDGETGYNFFIKYLPKINFKDNNSDTRRYNIALIKKYYSDDKNLMDKWLVSPAGLRDYIIDENGQPTEDEVNNLYRKLLGTSNLLKGLKIEKDNLDMYDAIRIKIQNITLEIYEYYENLLKGKKKFLQGKWTKRAIVHGTRNVITSLSITTEDLNSENKVGFNNTIIGLYQYIEAINPITKYHVMNKFTNRIFNSENNVAILVNNKTMETEHITINVSIRDKWISDEGLDSTISKMGQDAYRSKPITIDDHYLMLIYDDGKNIELVYNTANLREGLNKKYLRPITYGELFYLAIYDVRDKYPGYLTRYPITGVGGIYPSIPYVKTTVNSRTVILNENGNTGNTKTVYEYPILNEKYYNSLSPAVQHIANLGGDFDGFVRAVYNICTNTYYMRKYI